MYVSACSGEASTCMEQRLERAVDIRSAHATVMHMFRSQVNM